MSSIHIMNVYINIYICIHIYIYTYADELSLITASQIWARDPGPYICGGVMSESSSAYVYNMYIAVYMCLYMLIVLRCMQTTRLP